MQQNRYCVYLHKKKQTGEVFYIGSGTYRRPYSASNRSKAWRAVAKEFEMLVEIYKNNLSMQEARNLEQELIESGKFTELVNTNRVAQYNIFTDEDIKSISVFLRYDESSPTCLSYTDKTNSRRVKPNSQAGALVYSKNGTPVSSSICFMKKKTTASRIVWMLFNGQIPYGYVVDHIDGNPHNNKIDNLRIVTIGENSRNVKRSSCKEDCGLNLPKGIYFKSGFAEGAIAASVRYLDKSFGKHFSIRLYGIESAIEKAKAWRATKLKELGILNDYTDRHIGFDSEEYLNKDFSQGAIGKSKIWGVYVDSKDGVPISVSAGVGTKYRKYFSVGEIRSYEEAIELAKKHMTSLKEQGLY